MFVSMFAAKYELNLVAGNFINSIGGGAAVDELLCRFSCFILKRHTLHDPKTCRFTRCTGTPFPAPIPGVNDQPACEQTQLVTTLPSISVLTSSTLLRCWT